MGENAESSEIIREVLNEEDVDDDYRLYELLSKSHDLSTGGQLIAESYVYRVGQKRDHRLMIIILSILDRF